MKNLRKTKNNTIDLYVVRDSQDLQPIHIQETITGKDSIEFIDDIIDRSIYTNKNTGKTYNLSQQEALRVVISIDITVRNKAKSLKKYLRIKTLIKIICIFVLYTICVYGVNCIDVNRIIDTIVTIVFTSSCYLAVFPKFRLLSELSNE